jgi:hypothetical protein
MGRRLTPILLAYVTENPTSVQPTGTFEFISVKGFPEYVVNKDPNWRYRDGTLLDPWGNPIEYGQDLNDDGKIVGDESMYGCWNPHGAGNKIAVGTYSRGNREPNRTNGWVLEGGIIRNPPGIPKIPSIPKVDEDMSRGHGKHYRDRFAPSEYNLRFTAGEGAKIPRPKLFKSTRYPPETAEEIAMWDWWHAIQKADPDFQWKMIIDFYGRVIDQTGAPIKEARVHYKWTSLMGVMRPDGDPEADTTTDDDGRFKIGSMYGKRLIVQVSKELYEPTKKSSGAYEYAAFQDELFHVPDAGHPVEFVLTTDMGSQAKPVRF